MLNSRLPLASCPEYGTVRAATVFDAAEERPGFTGHLVTQIVVHGHDEWWCAFGCGGVMDDEGEVAGDQVGAGDLDGGATVKVPAIVEGVGAGPAAVDHERLDPIGGVGVELSMLNSRLPLPSLAATGSDVHPEPSIRQKNALT